MCITPITMLRLSHTKLREHLKEEQTSAQEVANLVINLRVLIESSESRMVERKIDIMTESDRTKTDLYPSWILFQLMVAMTMPTSQCLQEVLMVFTFLLVMEEV